MFGVAFLPFLAHLALASVVRRDAQAVYNDISGIDATVRNLTAAIDAYNGGILQTQPVFDATIAIHNVNRKGFADAQASSAFSSADSQRIVQHVSDSVGVSIPQSVQAIEAKKPLFDAAQVSSLVEATIQLLKYDHETFSAAVGEKLSADQLGPGLAAAGAIDAVLQGAALYYAV